MIAALYVDPAGVYANLPDVEVWGQARDARRYDGPWPVVAHPPCSRWCKLAGVVEARYGYRRGEDDGCFEAALASVRRFGGVLEHPAYSLAWRRYELPTPSSGGWTTSLFDVGATTHVEQGMYGHPACKETWLYAVGVELPGLRWGTVGRAAALVSWCANHTRADDDRPRVGKAVAAATPAAFRDVLLAMARTAGAVAA